MKTVTVRVASHRERAAALRLVTDVYCDRGYTERLKPLEGGVMLVAAYDRGIIGSASVVVAAEGTLLPTESYFGVNAQALAGGRNTVEAGRLAIKAPDAVTKRSALIGLLAAVQLWSDAQQASLVVASLYPWLARALAVLGIPSTVIAGSDRLRPDTVPFEYRRYFFPKTGSGPVAVTIDLDASRPGILGCLGKANDSIVLAQDFSTQVTAA